MHRRHVSQVTPESMDGEVVSRLANTASAILKHALCLEPKFIDVKPCLGPVRHSEVWFVAPRSLGFLLSTKVKMMILAPVQGAEFTLVLVSSLWL